MSDGIDHIAAERRRQIEEEGWTAENDDRYTDGSLALAGASYATTVDPDIKDDEYPPSFWPWAPRWWKPSDDPIRNLVKAGALIAAEIDRLDRLARGAQESER